MLVQKVKKFLKVGASAGAFALTAGSELGTS